MDPAFWNERYGKGEFAYGKLPHNFLNEFIEKHYLLPISGEKLERPLKALCICDGEGRNSIYLARKGFEVTAMDFSEVGMTKLTSWATEENLPIEAIVCDLATFEFGEQKWDLVVSIFAHVPPDIRKQAHEKIIPSLRPNGVFLFVAYHPSNIGRGTGGPQAAPLCATMEQIAAEINLSAMVTLLVEELEEVVDEGPFHTGLAAVTRVVAKSV